MTVIWQVWFSAYSEHLFSLMDNELVNASDNTIYSFYVRIKEFFPSLLPIVGKNFKQIQRRGDSG